MTDPQPCDTAACPFLGCHDCAFPGGVDPQANTHVSAGQTLYDGGILQARETPASAATDRGRDHRPKGEPVIDAKRTPAPTLGGA